MKINKRVYSLAVLAPVFAQLIRTSDRNQNSGARLVLDWAKRLSKRLIQKVKSPSVHNNDDNDDNLLDHGSRLQAGLVQHRHTYNKI